MFTFLLLPLPACLRSNVSLIESKVGARAALVRRSLLYQ